MRAELRWKGGMTVEGRNEKGRGKSLPLLFTRYFNCHLDRRVRSPTMQERAQSLSGKGLRLLGTVLNSPDRRVAVV